MVIFRLFFAYGGSVLGVVILAHMPCSAANDFQDGQI
jgi:hypothetical protein